MLIESLNEMIGQHFEMYYILRLELDKTATKREDVTWMLRHGNTIKSSDPLPEENKKIITGKKPSLGLVSLT